MASSYPKNRMEIIVVNDGSTDNTAKVVRQYISELGRFEQHSTMSRNPRTYELTRRIRRNKAHIPRVVLVNQKNAGKAAALNNGIKNYASGRLIMCLDGDSLVHPKMIENSVAHFRDRTVTAMASNVNIIEDGTVLSLVQRFEYILCGHMKKAQSSMNVEYIIGGIGSVYRRSAIKRVDFYDTNTMTEDIDLSMKIVGKGNKKHRLIFAADAITYTESVQTVKSLLRQRYRWKYGRMQTFLKNRQIFFNTGEEYGKALTWVMLPFTLVQEFFLFLEPLVIGYLFYTSIHYRNPMTVIFVATIISIYLLLAVWSTEHLSVKEKVRLSVLAPTMYFLIYLLTLVEYFSLVLSLAKVHKLRESIAAEFTTWKSPERSGIATHSS
jgi:cellulose synthase/poly-beta-1,6-N-acetylglucosamine synthase-like glycosyltransferase